MTMLNGEFGPELEGDRDEPRITPKTRIHVSRAIVEGAITFSAIMAGTAGVLCHLWVLDVLSLLCACVAFGMLLDRVLQQTYG